MSNEKIYDDVSKFNDSTLRTIELLLIGSNSDAENNEFVKDIIYINPRITSITFHTSYVEKCDTYFNFLSVRYTKTVIFDETCCGSFATSYLTPQTQLYLESLSFNNCLNQKISIDRFGKIKNCPSMLKIFGDVQQRPDFRKIAESENFRKVWNIKKDDIDVCKECELRYVCVDCRAYLTNPAKKYSKPLKCHYIP